MKKKLFMRAISLMLAAILCMGLLAPASTAVPAEGTTKLEFTQVDNRAVSAQITPAEFTQAEDASPYQATDVVRVSILLDGKSTLEAATPPWVLQKMPLPCPIAGTWPGARRPWWMPFLQKLWRGSHWMWCGT